MKNIWPIGLLAFSLMATTTAVTATSGSAASAADLPDLVGVWEGLSVGYDDGEGYYGEEDNYTVTLTIAEQRGRIFNGTLVYLNRNGREVVEEFAGAIGPDNSTFYLAEFDSGYDVGTIISEDEIELLYLQDGERGGVSVETLRRVWG